jgi:hypothetical protein
VVNPNPWTKNGGQVKMDQQNNARDLARMLTIPVHASLLGLRND